VRILKLDVSKYSAEAYAALVQEARKHKMKIVEKKTKTVEEEAQTNGWEVGKNNGTKTFTKGV